MAWLSGWANRIEITVDDTNIDSNLTYFPIPIALGTSVGQSGADVSAIFDELGAESKKIAVTEDDGETQLYVEIELWDNANEKAALWVSRSDFILPSTGTTLYLYYDSTQSDNIVYVGTPGNRDEVWNSNFDAVYTLAQDPTGGTDCIIDSSGNGNHGTPHNMVANDLVDGQIGKALDFDGSDQHISIGNPQDGKASFSWLATIKTSQSLVPSEDYEMPVFIGTIQGGGDSDDAILGINDGNLSWYDELDTGSLDGNSINDNSYSMIYLLLAPLKQHQIITFLEPSMRRMLHLLWQGLSDCMIGTTVSCKMKQLQVR